MSSARPSQPRPAEPDGFEWRRGETSPVQSADPVAAAAARRFRDVLGRFASGVTVVTGVSRGEPVGMTCQSFSSVSLDPPLVLFVPATTSRAWPRMREAGTFCVNVLAAGQEALSERMASRGTDKFSGVDWRPSAATGSPVLGGAIAWVDCRIHAVHEAGDHHVVLGRVLDLGVPGPGDAGADAEPLLFFRGDYIPPS
ncbi:flavin reductase family protein [Nocardioides sp. GCM10027113]|uniref:flavin reductase family protein n=1 Tax=unclassified Nocardioides TaxID=2615069 RepID=UPI0036190387